MLANEGPVTETKVPEKNPYEMQNRIAVPLHDTVVQQRVTMAQKRENGIITFRGPMTSAKKLGMILPNIDDALRMARR